MEVVPGIVILRGAQEDLLVVGRSLQILDQYHPAE